MSLRKKLALRTSFVALATLFVFAHGVSAQAAEADVPSSAGKSAKDAASADAQPVRNVSAESVEKAPSAKPDTRATEEPTPAAKGDDFGHRFRFGLRMGGVGGLRMVFRYSGDSAFCKQPSKDEGEKQKFCGHQAPYALESALSFAVTDSLEPFAWGRFGLSSEPETNTKPLKLIGIGTRIYNMSDARLKVFFEPAVAWELEGGGSNPEYQNFEYKKDLAFHVGGGLQVELQENVGFFLAAGMTTAVIRSLSSNLEVQLGVQGRTPAL
ncbi:MAG: hypothetical protein SFV15_02660 [Polyangiaceae bacterium]|nr:hypothetical protein [Polyangiaceae bacterium]